MEELEASFNDLEFNPDEEREADINSIQSTLERSTEGGLTLEVLYEAFSQLKSDPTISISQACENALWDC